MRSWLRQHSTVFRHFSPPHQHITRCGGCGSDLSSSTHFSDNCYGSVFSPNERHLIGTAHKQNQSFDKWCDGTETPRA